MAGEKPGTPRRTIIVDASEAFLASVLRWAEDQPELVVVATARSGPDALAAVERHKPDLVILDAVLPGLDGFQVVRQLKTRPGAPVAVIATFPASSAARSEALAAGADGFVAKEDFSAAFEMLLVSLPRPAGGGERDH